MAERTNLERMVEGIRAAIERGRLTVHPSAMAPEGDDGIERLAEELCVAVGINDD